VTPVAARHGADGRPAAFRWRRRWRRVAEVLEEWVYRPAWWEPDAGPERTFYRVRDEAGAVFELAVTPDGRTFLHRTID
jgi:hypothetical protein